MGANQEIGATDVEGAAARISSFLKPEQPGLPTESKSEATEEQSETAETSQDDTATEEPRYKVKVGDEERDVTIEDLRKGYMMEADYRKKTSEVAEKRKSLETKAAQIEEQLAEAKTLLDLDIESLQSPEMQELKEIDPEAYLKQFDKVQKKVDKFNKLKQKREAEQMERQRELNQKEYEALMTAIPEWLDETTRNTEVKEVFSSLSKLGYSEKELQNLADHRVFAMARKAHMFDKIQTQDLESKKVRTPPKTQQPGTANNAQDRQSTESKNLKAKLQKSGNMRDAANLFKSFMK
jgi:hypothetical protein